jgi:hypothetical protein
VLIGNRAQRVRSRRVSDETKAARYPLVSKISNNILARIDHTPSVTPALKGRSHRSGLDNRKCQTLCLMGKNFRRH